MWQQQDVKMTRGSHGTRLDQVTLVHDIHRGDTLTLLLPSDQPIVKHPAVIAADPFSPGAHHHTLRLHNNFTKYNACLLFDPTSEFWRGRSQSDLGIITRRRFIIPRLQAGTCLKLRPPPALSSFVTARSVENLSWDHSLRPTRQRKTHFARPAPRQG
jgi:hypothetical protein